jgi:hypothetical protein
MSYCPKCQHEYADSVQACVDCGRPLRRGRRAVRYALELEDLFIPVGTLVCGFIALAMLWLRVAAQFGWINGPLVDLVKFSQPPFLTAFYAIAAIACVVVFALWFVMVIIRRE